MPSQVEVAHQQLPPTLRTVRVDLDVTLPEGACLRRVVHRCAAEARNEATTPTPNPAVTVRLARQTVDLLDAAWP